MKKLNIYIDFAGTKEAVFSKNLKTRLKNLKGIGNVLTYSDLDIGEIQIGEDEYQEDWEFATIEAIKNADIVISILSSGYLDFINQEIEDLFSKIIESKNKFFFPILFTPSQWGSYNWIVKSKLFPENGKSISEHSETEVDAIINNLISTIKNIIIKTNKPIDKKEKESSKENIVFISHDHDDADFAELLKLKLEKQNINGWIDSERLKIGQDWRQEIDDGIKKSVAVIVIMTPEARKSEYVTYEWAFAWGKDRNVFPIMLKQTQLHPRLESLQYLDFTNRAARPWDKLIESIQSIINNLP